MSDLSSAEIRGLHLGVLPLLTNNELMWRNVGHLEHYVLICQITVYLAVSSTWKNFQIQLNYVRLQA